ncbi:hypothetical protein C8J57DRAFT_1105686, partial [Mycena rebaudengoi]
MPGLYGETDAYYGTVEQQGRLTLHMHMLVWIRGALSPQEIRDRISASDSDFQKSLIDYLESTHIGEFMTGTITDIRAKLRQTDYIDPTQCLPTAPPPPCITCTGIDCQSCHSLKIWRKDYKNTVDDLILRSNVHKCRTPVEGTDFTKKLKPGAKIKYEVKGCTRKDGTCSARFPRAVFSTTEVDLTDGSINMRHLEPSINTITPAVTYSLGCNTDVTCLLSGTSIKAVVAYVSDYVTKMSLKTFHVFQTVQDIFHK